MSDFCIWPEMPYCPDCPFGGMDYSDCETRDDIYFYARWRDCSCTKESLERYLAEHGGDCDAPVS